MSPGWCLVAALLVVGCGKSAPSASAPDGSRAPSGVVEGVDASIVRDPELEPLWTRAKQSGDADDLARLADREGEAGLRARAASDVSMRLVAVRALAYAPEPGAFYALPYLAREAAEAPDDVAMAALDSTVDLAARPRRAIDPEDAAEMKEGCDALLAFAKDPGDGGAPIRARRVKAIRALRMLADRGCVDAKDVPADLDAK